MRVVPDTHNDWTRSPKLLNLFGLSAGVVLHTEMYRWHVYSKLSRTKDSCSDQSSVAQSSVAFGLCGLATNRAETGSYRRSVLATRDRLDPIGFAVVVDERDHHFGRRSSSACAKNWLALLVCFGIELIEATVPGHYGRLADMPSYMIGAGGAAVLWMAGAAVLGRGHIHH
jgi:hypothetical protein